MVSDVETLGAMLARANRVLVVTGAGVSTESGIPDFRGPNGIWNTRRPVYFQDFVGVERKRIVYWQQHSEIHAAHGHAEPGPVHRACARLDQAGRLRAVVTQNVDGLHHDGGLSSDKVIEVHGTGRKAACLDCGAAVPIADAVGEFRATGVPPMCTECGGLMKPATISFGQQLDPLTVQRAIDAADECDLVIALGSTLSVYPAADISIRAASRGVPYAIVNQGATDHDGDPLVTLRIEGEVGTVFGEAVEIALHSA